MSYPSILSVIGLLGAAVTLSADPAKAAVVFRIVDEDGRRMPYRVDHFIHIPTGKDYAASFSLDRLEGEGLPFGSYDYALRRRDGVGELKGGTSLLKESVVITIGVSSFDYSCRGGCVDSVRSAIPLRGQLVPRSGPTLTVGDCFVRMQNAFGFGQAWFIDVRVDRNGRFEFEDPPSGKWVLITTCGQEILDVRQAPVRHRPGESRLVIDLSK